MLKKIAHWRKHRPWKDQKGKLLFRARLITFKNRQIHFQDITGKKRKLPMEQLIQADQAWFLKELKKLKGYRLWYDSQGKPLMLAKLVGFKQKKCVFLEHDRTEQKWPLEALSPNDQAWLTQKLRNDQEYHLWYDPQEKPFLLAKMVEYHYKIYTLKEQDGTEHRLTLGQFNQADKQRALRYKAARIAFKKEYRLWRDSRGRPRLRAKFLAFSRNQVLLREPNGVPFVVHMSEISLHDRRWVSYAKYWKNRKSR